MVSDALKQRIGLCLALGLLGACGSAPSPVVSKPPLPSDSATRGASSAAPALSGAASIAASPTPAAPTPIIAPTLPRFDSALRQDPDFAPAPDSELKLPGQAIDDLIAEAEKTHSDSLLVLQNGRLIIERYFGKRHGPIETMSITKSLSALAVGALIDEGKIPSVDVPLGTFFPEWKKGQKAKVTLRHVLTHTTGLHHRKTTKVLYSQKDQVAFVRKEPLEDEPGRVFAYSNEGAQLVAGVVKVASGKPIDQYLQEKLFSPLGIERPEWGHDRTGNPQTFAGLKLTARDLARVGTLMLQGGKWKETQVLSEDWVRAATSQGSEANKYYGFLWWIRLEPSQKVLTADLLSRLEQSGLTQAQKLTPLVGRPFREEAFWLEAGAVLPKEDRARLAGLIQRGISPLEAKDGAQIAFYADGSLGQKLAVYPRCQLVAVRQHRSERSGENEGQRYGFQSFYAKLDALCQASQSASEK